MSKRDDLGRGVLEDLAALRAKGSISSILPARRVDPVPNTLAQEMSAGYIQTIARLKSERESGKVVLELDPKQVRASELANRHALSLKDEDEDLNRLKAARAAGCGRRRDPHARAQDVSGKRGSQRPFSLRAGPYVPALAHAANF